MHGTPSSSAVDKWMPRLLWTVAAVGSAVSAYRNFPWFRSLADNLAFMLVFPLVLAGVRWWFRSVVWPAAPPGAASRPGEDR